LSVIASKLAYEARAEIDSGDLRSAYDNLASARTLDPSNSEVAATNRALQAKLADIADQERLAEAQRLAEAERLAEEQRAAEALAAATAAADESAQASINQQPVPVSSLTRTQYAAPKYPRGAQRREQSGWVDVVFTVLPDGTVADIEVRDSEPGKTFDSAAVKAVEKWEFEPVVENGSVVEKRAGVRLMFALE
jgi:TonB family protein